MRQQIIIIKNVNILFPIFLIGLALSLLSGCSSQHKKADKKSAASYNAQLGARYLQAGRITLAREKLKKALKQDNNSSEVHHYYALLQQKIGKQDSARQHFEKAVKINANNPNLLNNYGSHLCQRGHYQKAIQQFDLAAKDPFYKTPEFAYTNAGICLRKTQDDTGAEQYFRKALDKNINFGSALFQMAKLNYHRKNFAKAQAFLLRYDDNNPPAVESLALCIKINTQLDDRDKANHCIDKKLRLFPE
jgi:type IV pilus assembly protein PilF